MTIETDYLEERMFKHDGKWIDPNFFIGEDKIRIAHETHTAVLPAGKLPLSVVSGGILTEMKNCNLYFTQSSNVFVIEEPWPLVRSNTGPNLAISFPMHVKDAINDSNDLVGLIGLARIYKLDHIADRLIDFSEIDEEEEEGQEPLLLSSAKFFLDFIIHNRQLFDPLIALCADGNLQAEWHTKDNEHLAIKFLPNSKVRYSILTPSRELSSDNIGENLSGFTSIDKLFSTLEDFQVHKWKK